MTRLIFSTLLSVAEYCYLRPDLLPPTSGTVASWHIRRMAVGIIRELRGAFNSLHPKWGVAEFIVSMAWTPPSVRHFNLAPWRSGQRLYTESFTLSSVTELKRSSSASSRQHKRFLRGRLIWQAGPLDLISPSLHVKRKFHTCYNSWWISAVIPSIGGMYMRYVE